MRHAQIPLLAASDNRLGKNDYKVLIALSAHADRNGKCHPKRETLSKITGIDINRISVITGRLESLGWLKKSGDGGRSSPVNYLLVTSETLTETVRDNERETLTETVSKTLTETARGKEHTNEQKKKYIKKKNGAFREPTPEEVAAYAKGIGFNLDGNRFVDYYQSKGWVVGKTGMKDWQAAVRTWKRNSKNANGKKPAKSRNEQHGDIYRDIYRDIEEREAHGEVIRGAEADLPGSVDEQDRDQQAGDRGIDADLDEGTAGFDGRGYLEGTGQVAIPVSAERQGIQDFLPAFRCGGDPGGSQAASGFEFAETQVKSCFGGRKH